MHFTDMCTFSLNGVSNPCTYVTGWDENVDDNELQLVAGFDFTCGGACYPNRGDLLQWNFEIDFGFLHSDGINDFWSGVRQWSGSTTVPLNPTESLQCSSSINGPWNDSGLNWDGIAANMICLTDIASVSFPNPLDDISDFTWNCSFSVNGNNYGCTNGNQTSWEISPSGQRIEFNNQLDFTCGGSCQPVAGDELSWNFSLNSIGIGYPPVTIFIGSTSASGSVTLP